MLTRMWRRVLVVVMTLAAVSAGFAAGSAEGERSSSSAEERVPIRFFKPGLPETWPDDPVVHFLNDKLNIDLEFVSPSWADYQQKRNLMLSTDAPMDVYSIIGDIQWVEDGAIIAVDEYLEDQERYPWLNMVCYSDTYKAELIDGKVYHIPGVNDGAKWAWSVRQDWMDELGLSQPQNEEDFRNMLQAFKDRDPSGQTVGWCIEGNFAVRRSVFPVLLSYGLPAMMLDATKAFYVEDGRLGHMFDMPAFEAAFRYLNSLYLDELINTDFPGMNFQAIEEKYFRSGKTGVMWAHGAAGGDILNLGGTPGMIDPFSAMGFEFNRGGGALENMRHGISVTSENPERALDLMEYGNSSEGRMLFITGIEGVHWENLTADGYYDRLPAFAEEYGDMTALPYHFHFTSHSLRGLIPYQEYSTFEEAYANILYVEDRALKGTPASNLFALQQGAKWAEGPHDFKFWSVPALREIEGELEDIITTYYVRMIGAPDGEFEQVYQEFRDELNRAGWDRWMSGWTDLWETNIR